MTPFLESRLWLALHLLYPNSSQAFDIYQAMESQAGKAIEKDDRIAVFAKLVTIFEKIPPITSNLSFYEFTLEDIDQWKALYKNSQKNQLLSFVGVLIFDLKISDIAPFVDLPLEKVQFLFHQMFKKLVQNNLKTKPNEPVNSIKQNESKISYLYTYENLIEYCLGQLPESDSNKVKIGLDLYPALQIIRDEYVKIINQMQSLKVQRSYFIQSKSKNRMVLVKTIVDKNGAETPIVQKQNFFYNKNIIASVFSAFILTVFMLFQFTDIYNPFKKTDNTIVIQQFVKKHVDEVEQAEVAYESIPAEPMSNEIEFEASESEKPIGAETLDKVETKLEVQPQLAIKSLSTRMPLQEKLIVKQTEVNISNNGPAGYRGGLYRGTLIVNNLQSDNQQIRAKLIGLGAKKAGEVDLGWFKSKNMAYYHFIIPETSVAESDEYLKKLGRLGLKFETHPRLIPMGTKRFIIEVRGE
jgi:hypothetical protein